MNPLNDTMRQAMRLMKEGDLHAATRALQKGLSANVTLQVSVIDDHRPVEPTSGAHESDTAPIDGEWSVVDFRPANRARADRTQTSSGTWPRPTGSQESTDFTALRFDGPAGAIDYRLYVPEGLNTHGAPLLIMLHGCTQSPQDFARGTRMNALALEQGYVVAYPAQTADRNPNRCWNWFRPRDQKRGGGEAELLAALTRDLVATHQLDGRRVFVAGLSAGGAMAAVLAQAYPELYAAIGVHSGLPAGAARDVASAFAAMRTGGWKQGGESATGKGSGPRAIVFHGDRDATVHASNGHDVIAQFTGENGSHTAGKSSSTFQQMGVYGGRLCTRIIHRRPDDTVSAEHWIIGGGGHAWSGGDASGSYTDASGPEASREMLRFFSEHGSPGDV